MHPNKETHKKYIIWKQETWWFRGIRIIRGAGRSAEIRGAYLFFLFNFLKLEYYAEPCCRASLAIKFT